MEDLEKWIAKGEVITRTGLDERTIERKVTGGELRRAYRPLPGRRPLPVFHPEDIEKLLTRTLTPIPLATPKALVKAKPADLPAPLFVPVHRKVFLTIKEAEAYSGLPESLIRQALAAGTLAGIKYKAWYIRRDALESYHGNPDTPRRKQLPVNGHTTATNDNRKD